MTTEIDNKRTSIKLKISTVERIKSLGKMGETYDKLINKMADVYEPDVIIMYENIDGKEYPQYVRLNNTTMRLGRETYTDKVNYYRYNGGWDVGIKRKDGKLYSIKHGERFSHIHNVELIPISKDEYTRGA